MAPGCQAGLASTQLGFFYLFLFFVHFFYFIKYKFLRKEKSQV